MGKGEIMPQADTYYGYMNKRTILGVTTVAVMAGMLVTNVTFAANSTSTLAKSKIRHTIVKAANKPHSRNLLKKSGVVKLSTSAKSMKKRASLKHTLKKGAPKKDGLRIPAPETTSTAKTSD